jgi:catechol 2,3-dioxygenase-like lactoylglutathione lyase family enzyme
MSPQAGLRLGHVNLEVSDLERARRFYDRFLPVLGFRRLPMTDAAWLGYRKGRMTLWFTVSRPRRTRLGRPHVPTTGATDPISNHLGFRVPHESQVLQIERALRRQDITPIYGFSKVPTAGSTWYVSAAWRDNDNNVFEVYAVTRRVAKERPK